MSDTGIVTAQVGSFTVQSNSGGTDEELSARLKPQADKAAAEAASQLGKRGAEARKAKAAEAPEPEAAPAEEAKAEPAKPIKPIPPKGKEQPKDEPEEKAAAPAEESEDEPEAEGGKKESSRDRTARMLEATRQAAELKRQLAEERQTRDRLVQEFNQRLQSLERGPRQEPEPQRQPQGEQPEVGPDGVPPLKWFVAQHDSYEDGLEAWTRAREGTRERRHAEDQTIAGYTQRFAAALQEIPSQEIPPEIGTLEPTYFAQKAGKSINARNALADELYFRPEMAPTLVRHFKAHPEDLKRVTEQPCSADVSREVGRILGRLEAASAGVSTERDEEVSRATPPVRPVTGAPYVAETAEYRPGMSLDEYYKQRMKKLKSN